MEQGDVGVESVELPVEQVRLLPGLQLHLAAAGQQQQLHNTPPSLAAAGPDSNTGGLVAKVPSCAPCHQCSGGPCHPRAPSPPRAAAPPSVSCKGSPPPSPGCWPALSVQNAGHITRYYVRSKTITFCEDTNRTDLPMMGWRQVGHLLWIFGFV